MNRLRELRELQKLSTYELSEEVGIAYPTLRSYENGNRGGKKETWVKLAKFFNVSVPYIMGIEENNSNMITIPREEYDRLKKFEQSILNKVRDYERGD